MQRLTALTLTLVGAAALGACGDSGDRDSPGTMQPPAEGKLLQNPPDLVGTYTPTDLLGLLGVNGLGQALLQLPYSPICSISVYHIEYATVGGRGEPTTASGALMVPTGTQASCQGARPIVLYAHGTPTDRDFNIANLSASNNDEGLIVAALFAAQGYIVVAPNYAGYDSSTLDYHPYLEATQQSKDMIDALTASRSALPIAAIPATTANAKLFITGYSQGGYVAMATQRAMQDAGMSVTAAAPLSGPYALSAFGDALFYGDVSLGTRVSLTLLAASYQNAYQNVYAMPTDMFEAQYANGIESLLPSTMDISDIYSQGLLPPSALFSSTPPSSAYAADTPPTTPAFLAPVFAMGFATDALILNSYRLSYLQDAQASPDGGFPSTTTGLPPSNPSNGLRVDLKLNDLRNWTPTAPVLLCGGDEDPTVFYFNTQLMQAYWSVNAPSASLTVLDIDSGGGGEYASLKSAFAAAKALVAAAAVTAGATDGGNAAVLADYHAGLVPPFCVSAVKSFFDGF